MVRHPGLLASALAPFCTPPTKLQLLILLFFSYCLSGSTFPVGQCNVVPHPTACVLPLPLSAPCCVWGKENSTLAVTTTVSRHKFGRGDSAGTKLVPFQGLKGSGLLPRHHHFQAELPHPSDQRPTAPKRTRVRVGVWLCHPLCDHH